MRRLAMAHGAFNLVGGFRPLVTMRTFQAVFGPKTDAWLVYTVAGLLSTVGAAQLLSRRENQLDLARVLGIGTTSTLLAVDLANPPRGRISRVYLATPRASWPSSPHGRRSSTRRRASDDPAD